MSKSKIKNLILTKKMTGWNDPRLYTVRGMFNRGITYQSLDMIMKETGYPKDDVDLDPSAIWTINRKIIDKIATRYMAVSIDCVNIPIELAKDYPVTKQIQKFVRNISLGTRPIHYANEIYLAKEDIDQVSQNEEITLMNYGNVIYKDNILVSNLAGDLKSTKHKLTWIPNINNIVNIIIIDYDTDNNEVITKLLGEPSISEISPGNFIQIMKMDYYMCKSKDQNSIILIRIL